MRRWIIATAVAVAAVLVGSPVPAAFASTGHAGAGHAGTARMTTGTGWVPAPSSPFDRAAGVLCDFPIHAEPIVDEVQMRTLETYPDGSSKSELYVGRLIVRVTNTNTGAYYDADASGDAVITYGTDGSSTWFVVGPVLIGFRDGTGNLPRGLYVLNGVYSLAFDPSGYKTLNTLIGSQDNVCTHIA